jgi:drug/metabolite transporter (DMT)-like permease
VHVVWSPLVTGVVVFEGLFATVLCLNLQLRAQRVIAPTHAAVVYAFEPVVAAAASMALIGERLAPLQWAGGALILLGLMVPQADENLAAETGGIRPE